MTARDAGAFDASAIFTCVDLLEMTPCSRCEALADADDRTQAGFRPRTFRLTVVSVSAKY